MTTIRRKDALWFVGKALYALGVAVLLFGAATMLFPFIWMLLSSFKTNAEILRFPITWFPQQWVTDNYGKVLGEYNFFHYYRNTIMVTLINLFGELVVNSLAAYAFARIRFPGSRVIFLMLLAVSMIPSQMILIPSYIILTKLGWVNTLLALTIPLFPSVYGTFLMRQFFMTIPKVLEEAAIIDGCGRFKMYYKVMLPLCKPALMVYGIGIVLNYWNDLLWPLLMTSTEKMRTLAVGISAMSGQYNIQYNHMMAASCLSVAPLIVLFLCTQKYFIRGLVVTGIKI